MPTHSQILLGTENLKDFIEYRCFPQICDSKWTVLVQLASEETWKAIVWAFLLVSTTRLSVSKRRTTERRHWEQIDTRLLRPTPSLSTFDLRNPLLLAPIQYLKIFDRKLPGRRLTLCNVLAWIRTNKNNTRDVKKCNLNVLVTLRIFVPSKQLPMCHGNWQSPQPSSLTESRISASATGVRGLMIHLKGTGYLLRESRWFQN